MNLRVVHSQIFDKEQEIDALDVAHIFYAKAKPERMFEVVKLFMATIEDKNKGTFGSDYYEFVNKIYDEYFDNRLYLIE